MEQDLVGVPPESRRKMMKWTRNPLNFAKFGAEIDVLGAKSGTRWEPTYGQKGAFDEIWIPIKGIKEDESGRLPGDGKWTDSRT